MAEDVRITTRGREHDFVRALIGIAHETGHARDPALIERATGAPRSARHLRWRYLGQP